MVTKKKKYSRKETLAWSKKGEPVPSILAWGSIKEQRQAASKAISILQNILDRHSNVSLGKTTFGYTITVWLDDENPMLHHHFEDKNSLLDALLKLPNDDKNNTKARY